MYQRDKILRNARKSGKDFDWNTYKSLRNRCNNMIKNAKKRYHTELLNDNAKNPSKFWKTVKDVFPTKEKPMNLSTSASKTERSKFILQILLQCSYIYKISCNSFEKLCLGIY